MSTEFTKHLKQRKAETEAVINGVWLEEKPLRNDYEYLVARKK